MSTTGKTSLEYDGSNVDEFRKFLEPEMFEVTESAGVLCVYDKARDYDVYAMPGETISRADDEIWTEIK